MRLWSAAIQPAAALDDPLVHDTAVAMVETLLAHPLDVDRALERFGRRVGTDGWTLADAADWIDQLARLVTGHAGHLRRFDAGIALAHGWAAGFLYGIREDAAIDPITGLATLPLLALRLHQVYDQCRALGIDTTHAFGLLVVDVDLTGHAPLIRDAIRAVVADRVSESFHTGETVCGANGTVVVLVSRTPDLNRRVVQLERQLGTVAVLDGTPALVWLEDLPASPERIEHLLLDVARLR